MKETKHLTEIVKTFKNKNFYFISFRIKKLEYGTANISVNLRLTLILADTDLSSGVIKDIGIYLFYCKNIRKQIKISRIHSVDSKYFKTLEKWNLPIVDKIPVLRLFKLDKKYSVTKTNISLLYNLIKRN